MTTEEQVPGQPAETEAEKVLREQAEVTRKAQEEQQAGQGQASGVNADEKGLGGPQDPNPQPTEEQDAKPEKDEQA